MYSTQRHFALKWLVDRAKMRSPGRVGGPRRNQKLRKGLTVTCINHDRKDEHMTPDQEAKPMNSSPTDRPAQGPKYSIIPARAFDIPDLKLETLFVLGLYGIYANKAGQTIVGEETLAQRGRLSVRTVGRHTKR